MNATELLAELRPPREESPADDGVLERILLATPEPSPPRRRRRLTRRLAVAGATALAATAAVAFVPSGGGGPVGLSGAVAALTEPGVLLHFTVTTTHLPSGATETAETWQTPDGRRARMLRDGLEWAYDQRGRRYEIYVPERDEVIVHTTPEIFEDMPDPFGSIAGSAPSNPTSVGDLPALLTRALRGDDPDVRHVGRTRLRGIEVDRIRIERDMRIADAEPGAPPRELIDAPMKTVTIVRDVYVRHDNALPVRVVDHIEALGNPQNTTTISEFTGAQKLALDAATESSLKLAAHPGAKRTIRPPFDDSKADG